MTAHEASEQSKGGSKWLYIILTFLVLPAAFLLPPHLMRESLFFSWLIAAGVYVILLSASAATNQPSKERYRRVFKPTVRLLGTVVWSGFLAVTYLFLYYITFDRENLFPQ